MAHTTRVVHSPVVAANGLESVEEVVGIPLLLDLEQGRVIDAEESVLPVGLAEIGLVLVAAAARGDRLQLGHILVGHLVLIGHHVGPRSGLVPVGTDLHGDGGIAHGGEDGVGDITGLRDVHTDTDGDDTVLGDVTDDRGEASSVVVEHIPGDQPTTVLVLTHAEVTVGQGAHVLVVVLIVRGVLGIGNGVRDAQGIKDLEEGRQESLDIVGCLVVRSDRVDGEEGGGDLVDDGGAGINHLGQQTVELGDSLVEVVCGGLAGEELHISASNRGVGVRLDGGRDDHTIVTGTTTAESPEEVGVRGPVGSDQLSSRRDDLELQGVIGTQSVGGAEGGVSTSLNIATSEADGRTFTSDHHQTLGVSCLHHLEAHHTSTDLECGTLVVSVGPIPILNVVEVVHPNRKSTSTGGASKVTAPPVSIPSANLFYNHSLMTSVANDKADVVLAGEVDGSNHIVARGDIDGVIDVVAQGTRLGLCGEGVTALVGKVGLHDGRGGFNAAHIEVSFLLAIKHDK